MGGVIRRLGLAIALATVSGCAVAAHEAYGSSLPMPPSQNRPASEGPFGDAFDRLSARQEAPSPDEVARAFGLLAVPVRRADRHVEARFANGARYIRVAPPPADDRVYLDTGTMAALISPVSSSGRACISSTEAGATLIKSGWTSSPAFGVERHGGRPQRGEPTMLSRHDHRLRLYLFTDGRSPDCVARYVLAWNMDLAGLTGLLPDG